MTHIVFCRRKLLLALLFLPLQLLAAPFTSETDSLLSFLFRYMPLPDQTDYEEDFFRHNVEMSLKARQEMPWGNSIPDREFRHFVLPVRVNNENLDNSREVFFYQLRERVRGMSMSEAILEVNHWCHERVTYRPTDARTSSPLATVRTAYGRCGEESTLLVAALRAVAIPARQVYTPRWAHTDDNHAWVEAWADGQWHFLGACEPEPVLNLGWFNESASRGMLMHTKVFGDYDGPEEVMSRTACYTEINVIGNYAPTATLHVKVVDAKGLPVPDALVEFKLYNYAEFYTVANRFTDKTGVTSLTAGLGDMLLWVSKDGAATMRKVSFGKESRVVVTLDGTPLPQQADIDIQPPPVSAVLPKVSPAQRTENDRRLLVEDSIRRAYEQTMPVEAWRGNHQVICAFLEQADNRLMADKLLEVISAKDLRDIPMEVLRDNEVTLTDTSSLYCRYVLNPRVENEWLTPYKRFFRQEMASEIHQAQDLVEWCRKHLRIDNEHNPQQIRMRPMGVYKRRVTDELSRKIFFVSVARSLGIPARINEVDSRLQYHEDGKWHDVTFENNDGSVPMMAATLTLDFLPTTYIDNPKYYVHFTLSKMENGRLQLLTFPEEATWKSDFKDGVNLECGNYWLTVGTRMANGSVLARMSRLTLAPGDALTMAFTLRENLEQVQVIGTFNAENQFLPLAASSTPKTLLSETGRGYNVLGVIAPNHEPTNHALRDIMACKEGFEQWGRKLMLLVKKEEARRFNFGEFDRMPRTTVWGVDVEGKCMAEILKEMHLTSSSLPLFIIYDSFNRVVFVQQGYTIHLGEQLLQVIKKMSQ